jgi:hypothetical protein
MVKCPVCGKPQPLFRIPTNLRELLWGGWTCGNCWSEMNRKGKLIRKNKKKKIR